MVVNEADVQAAVEKAVLKYASDLEFFTVKFSDAPGIYAAAGYLKRDAASIAHEAVRQLR